LIDTLQLNFGVPVDHYVQIDFCAFRQLVDAVGGIEVPFERPARDTASGLVVTETGCVNLDGDMALSYVRSRKYEYEDPIGSGTWIRDGTSDLGRIARQQDFVRRTIRKAINDGLYSPDIASALITANRDYVVTDAGLTARRLLEFANTLRDLDAATITAYRIESRTEITAAGEDVQRPLINGSNMKAILSVFRGEALIASAPEQVLESTTTIALPTTSTSTTIPTATTTTTEPTSDESDADADADRDDGTAVTTTQAPTTVPQLEVTENLAGVSPSRDLVCN
jgi:LCP family protein required for cell wall assembly